MGHRGRYSGSPTEAASNVSTPKECLIALLDAAWCVDDMRLTRKNPRAPRRAAARRCAACAARCLCALLLTDLHLLLRTCSLSSHPPTTTHQQ